jgi:hypothetical protein
MNPTDVLLSTNGSPLVNPLSQSTRVRQANAAASSSAALHTAKRAAPPEQITEEDESEPASEPESLDEREPGRDTESDSDDEDDLPDAAAYTARLLSQSQSQSQSQPSRSAPSRSTKPKRNPSLLWRESLHGGAGPAAAALPDGKDDEDDRDRPEWASVVLPTGAVIRFDPLALDRAEMNQELVDRGLDAKQREEVGKLLQAEVVKALQSRMQSWY